MTAEEFLDRVSPRTKRLEIVPGLGKCNIWTGNARNGYGRLQVEGSLETIHRLAYELLVGLIPEGHDVCHICDRPLCWNPFHLFTGTEVDNVADCIAKGRRLGTSLSDSDVHEIRRLYAEGVTRGALADEYGIVRSTVSRIVTGKRRQNS